MSQRIYTTHLNKERQFLTDTINYVKQFLISMEPGIFARSLNPAMISDDQADEDAVIKLDAFGLMVVLYTNAFKEAFPKGVLTQEHKDKIDALWNALKYPQFVGMYTYEDVGMATQ